MTCEGGPPDRSGTQTIRLLPAQDERLRALCSRLRVIGGTSVGEIERATLLVDEVRLEVRHARGDCLERPLDTIVPAPVCIACQPFDGEACVIPVDEARAAVRAIGPAAVVGL